MRVRQAASYISIIRPTRWSKLFLSKLLSSVILRLFVWIFSPKSDEHLIPAHSLHLNHMRSPCSSSSLYSPGSGASSSSGVGIPSQIPRAHQHSVPTPLQPMSVYVEQHQHQQSQQHQSPHHIDVYSQLGMQRIGQMFKANMTANNNNSNCNNKNAKSQGYDAGIKLEQNMNNVKQLVESAIG